MAGISKYFYDQVFALGFDEDSSHHEGIEILEDLDETVASLRSKAAAENHKIRAVSGWLAPAEYIPSNLHGKSVFILVEAEDADWGMIVTSDAEDGEDLSREVERIIDVAETNTPYTIKIENIGLLYGQEISVTLSLDDDYLDDETAEVCETIVEQVKEMLEDE